MPEAQDNPYSTKEAAPRKDKLYLDMLNSNPDLRDKIETTMSILGQNNLGLPVLHITSFSIKSPNGNKIDTGFREKMIAEGFKKRDTNVSVFVVRKEKVLPASPLYFAKYPEKFLREIDTKLKRYLHHGTRTNKNIFEGDLSQHIGIPTILLIHASLGQLEKATDHDDHYILTENIPYNSLVGEVLLEGLNRKNNLEEITLALLKSLSYLV